MMVMIQDGRNLEFPGKFDAVWMGPHLVKEEYPNNSLQLETLNGESFPTWPSGSRCKYYRARGTACLRSKRFWVSIPDVRQLYEPK